MIRRFGLVCGCGLAICLGASARQEGEAAPPAAVTPEQQEMMEAYLQANAAGEAHKRLEPLIGKWKTTTTAWMDPSQPPMETKGKVKKSWALDGRFVQEEMSGETMVGPYTGIGYLGYDNATKKYQGVWMSSMSTALISFTGDMSEDGTLTCMGKESDALTGQILDFKMVVAIESPDRHVLTFWYIIPGMGEMKAFEIVHERAN